MSLSATPTRASTAHYVKFFTDRFNYSILVDTLLLGVQGDRSLPAVRLSHCMGRVARSSPRVQSILLFIVVLPDRDKRRRADVRLDRHPWTTGPPEPDRHGPGAVTGPLRLLYSEAGVVWSLRGCRCRSWSCHPDGHIAHRSQPVGRLARARLQQKWRTLFKGDAAAFHAGDHCRLHPHLRRLRHRLRDPDADRRRAPRLHASASTSRRSGRITGRFAATISVIFMVAVLGVVALLNLLAAGCSAMPDRRRGLDLDSARSSPSSGCHDPGRHRPDRAEHRHPDYILHGFGVLKFRRPAIPLRWYRALADADQMRTAALNSLMVAAWTTTISVFLGTGAAVAISRSRGWLARLLDGLFMSPLLLPALAFGFTADLHLPDRPASQRIFLVLGHVIVCACRSSFARRWPRSRNSIRRWPTPRSALGASLVKHFAG